MVKGSEEHREEHHEQHHEENLDLHHDEQLEHHHEKDHEDGLALGGKLVWPAKIFVEEEQELAGWQHKSAKTAIEQ